AQAERRERRETRRAGLRQATTGRLVRVGRPTGTLARRRRRRVWAVVVLLVVLDALVWVVRPDWPARLGAVVVSVLALPVLVTLLVPRRR
ncbi:MAG: hypothetical protein WB798_04020, partial [Nocardioidaceae bacterium]